MSAGTSRRVSASAAAFAPACDASHAAAAAQQRPAAAAVAGGGGGDGAPQLDLKARSLDELEQMLRAAATRLLSGEARDGAIPHARPLRARPQRRRRDAYVGRALASRAAKRSPIAIAIVTEE